MTRYILKRLIYAIPLLFFVSIVSFALIKISPGDPVQSFVTPNMSPEDVSRIRANMGLDQPVYVQYFVWLKTVVTGDLGYSLTNHRPVGQLITERLPATIGIMGVSLALSFLIAIPLGLLSAVNNNRFIDKALSFFAYVGISIPGFWFAMMLIYFFAVELQLLPSMGMRTIGVDSTWDLIKHAIMPCMALAISQVSVYMRYVRSSTISQLNEDYVQIQYAYGSKKSTILFRHVLRNVLLPLITIFGLAFPEIIMGAFIIETMFSWPGMGSLGVNAIFELDYPVIMGITMISSILLIVGNLAADILYGIADPRIKATG